ncbi:MAG: pyocin activator PrtN family protein [Pseudomonadota bacterium]|nr:pyocin activator PrtN family protein [Pseudomonadota bacterium]
MSAFKQFDQSAAEPIDTGFMLALRYRTPYIPLERVVQDFMTHLKPEVAVRRANAGTLPFPAFKPDGVKSPFLVSVADLAAYLDAQRAAAAKDWQAGQ